MDRDNQQATPTEAEIGWLAGIMEGEGTLSMTLFKRPRRKGTTASEIGNLAVTVHVRFYNSDAGIIKQVVSILQRMMVAYRISEREQRPMLKPDGNGHYVSRDPMLTVSTNNLAAAQRLLSQLRPWLYGNKAHRADLMLEFIEKRLGRACGPRGGRAALYTADEIRLVLRCLKTGTRANTAMVERVLNDFEQGAEQSVMI